MDIQLDKARKLITELETKLNATSAHAAEARIVLDEWLRSGEARLRKKSAAALKQVRKRADGFAKSLTKLEKNLGQSLEKMSASLEKGVPAKGGKAEDPKPSKQTKVASVKPSTPKPSAKKKTPPRKRAGAVGKKVAGA